PSSIPMSVSAMRSSAMLPRQRTVRFIGPASFERFVVLLSAFLSGFAGASLCLWWGYLARIGVT
ncbi:MAG: hypothetical protein M3Y13_09010, partial [Armatimonadota bacterium]|nr:hypothetical protein [Armatimonadota bacterium]